MSGTLAFVDGDLLTDVLRDTCLSRRVLDLRELSPDVALRFPCDRSIGLHLVARGTMHLHAPGMADALALSSGDIAVMARGCDHVLSTRPGLEGQRVESIDAELPAGGMPATQASDVISGAYQMWSTPLHPFFAEMPPWSVLRASEMPRLGPIALSTALIEAELRSREPGRTVVVHGLLDVIFALALRAVSAQCAQARSGWSQAVRDPHVRRAIALMHENAAHPWTLDELAQRAGLSRTALAGRFRDAMGDTPLNHLRTLRMQRASRLLADTDRRLEAIARAVGYQDAFGFSKVFKRTLGVSPKEFRRRDAGERKHPYRFHGA
ncbi:MAG: AraC family transcriptional regulator [Burkholderiaceae bacterium]|nr:AraC family transcriptional regulator [Burkholderiaceae bacterium]